MAIGLIFAAQLGNVLGRIGDERVKQHLDVVGEQYGLDTNLPAGLDPHQLLELMRRDKKALTGLTFVLDGADGVELVADVDDQSVLDALARMM